MASKPLEVADIFHRFFPAYAAEAGHRMMPSQRRAAADIMACMTAEMGGGRYQCGDCNESFWSYHGCRNRACPKCHGRQVAQWMEKRTAELLPCDYFHLVATVPAELRSHFLRHQKALYGLLMKSVAGALCELAQDKRYLGATPAILAVLHTWTGKMHHHPHVHLLVSGGGVTQDGETWRAVANRFLVPVKKLSPMISQRFARTLAQEHPELFSQIPSRVWKREWCSFCKHFGEGKEAVLQYLSRYVFRMAINNSRIVAMDESHVTFRYKENSTGDWKTERIPGVDFIRRYLLHVLPKGFHKVRYYSLWSAPNRQRHAAARILLQLQQQTPPAKAITLLADLVEEALSQSELEAHAFTIKCDKNHQNSPTRAQLNSLTEAT